jgi:hypothetical protein
MFITVYVALFVPEKDPELVRILEEEKAHKRAEKRQKRKETSPTSPGSPDLVDSDDEEEPIPDISQTFAILKDVISNKNIQYFFFFMIICRAPVKLEANLAQIYLTNDLGFPKEDLSIIQVLCTPINILAAFAMSYIGGNRPFYYTFWCILAEVIVSSYLILVLLYTFPEKDQMTGNTKLHVTICFFLTEFVQNCEFVMSFAIICKLCDKRVSGIHLTLLGSLSNFGEFFHKFYLFRMVDVFGIFGPQVILSISVLLIMLFNGG